MNRSEQVVLVTGGMGSFGKQVVDIAEAIAPGCQVEYIGIRPDEKVHEVLVSEDEARNTVELDDMYVIQPNHGWWHAGNWKHGRALREGFQHASDSNTDWISGRDFATPNREPCQRCP